MKIQCVDQQVSELLQGNFYYIPRFQRPYRWDRENIEDFLRDTLDGASNEYFIGSIVLFGKLRLGITDGQQRLTTIVIILCVLRDLFDANGAQDHARGVQAIIERSDIENRKRFVIDSETSYPYLQDHILRYGQPSTAGPIQPEERTLKAAHEQIREYLNAQLADVSKKAKAKTAKEKAVSKYLVQCRNKVLGLNFIYVRLETEDEAYTIFETLNTRGKDLTVADVVKSYLLKYAKALNGSLDTPKDQWKQLTKTIEGSASDLSVSVFLYHFWLSWYGFVAQPKLYRAMRTQVKPADAGSFLTELVTEATRYREINEPGYRKWTNEEQPIQDSFRALQVFRVRMPVPLLMAVMRCYAAKSLKLKSVTKVVKAVEYFHFVFTAVTSQRSSGGIASMYSLHARQLTTAASDQARANSVADLLKKLRAKRPSYPEFETDFIEIKYSEEFPKQSALVRYILEGIDRHHRGGAPIDYKKMTVEHIASQGNPAASACTAEEVARIGNLVFIDATANGGLANKPFAAKKAILMGEPALVADAEFAKASKWGPKEIEARGRRLAKLAYDTIWKF